jgi:hypothetical protein
MTETSKFRQVFSNRHVLLPVIHVETVDQALRNAGHAVSAGCDGFFLINHDQPYEELLGAYRIVRSAHPTAWIGVNCLDLFADDVFSALDADVNGVWVDNARIDETSTNQEKAERIAAARRDSGWQGLYFGGVAFKGQQLVTDLEGSAAVSARFMDVITTSGPGTGFAAEVDKIRRMKNGAGKGILGIASGITPENVTEYLPYANCFLVASGISASFTELDPLRIKALVDVVRNGSPTLLE